MQFTLGVFAFLGVFLSFFVGKNLEDAKKVASQLINREVENKITDLVQSEVESVKRSLQRERVIGTTVVDYYLPSDDMTEPDDCKLLRTRGFAKVRFWNQKRKPKKPVGDIFVLDLINSKLLEGQEFAALSKDDAKLEEEFSYSEFRSQNESVGDSDPPLIVRVASPKGRRPLNLRFSGGLKPLDSSTSRTKYPTEFWLLTPEFCFDKREEKVKTQIDLALNLLDKTTVLVIYIDGFSEEVKNLATRVDYYYIAANTSITLIGIVADSAYVAHGQHNL